jgi:thiol-disulfide isomerase/thioredoxin
MLYSSYITRFALIVTIGLTAFVGGARARKSNSAAGVVNLDGSPIDPFQQARGKVTVLIFVRTNCPIANRYAPEIRRLSAQHRGAAEFFLVYVDKKESIEAIRNHDREYKYGLPAVRDLQHSLVKLSQAQITPEAAVFDAARHLVYHGRIDNLYEDFSHARIAASTHELDQAIRAALAGQPAAAVSVPAVGCYIADLE